MLETSNRLAIAGTAFLAIGMTAVVFLITDILFEATWAAVTAAVIGGTFAWFWYGLPLIRDVRDGPASPFRISRTIRSATSAVTSAEPTAVGITSTTSAPTTSSRRATSRQAQSRSPLVIPPGSGVPVPGAKAGSSTSTSTVR